MSAYDAKNPTALKQLVGAGAQLRPFPKEVMDACYKAAQELFAETSAKNPEFKKIYDDYKKFMADENLWLPHRRRHVRKLYVQRQVIIDASRFLRQSKRELRLPFFCGRLFLVPQCETLFGVFPPH
jgi:pyoverdine/dityrosine biosynthesis protein Dit1